MQLKGHLPNYGQEYEHQAKVYEQFQPSVDFFILLYRFAGVYVDKWIDARYHVNLKLQTK